MKGTSNVTRRQFLGVTASAGACLCGLGGCIAFSTAGDTPQIHPQAYKITQLAGKTRIIIDTVEIPELLKDGSAVKIIDQRVNDSIIVANTGKNYFVALSISCTHNGYEVEYKHDKKIFKCISLNRAEFSLDGRVIDGPTTKALTSYPIRLQNQQLIISNVA